MSRFAAILMLAGVGGIVPSSVRHQLPPMTPAAADLVGTWTGTFKTDMGDGEATLVVTKKDAYGATFELKLQHPVEMGDVTDLKVDDKTISWSQHIMDADCKAQAALEDGQLKGGMNCGLMAATFSLVKS